VRDHQALITLLSPYIFTPSTVRPASGSILSCRNWGEGSMGKQDSICWFYSAAACNLSFPSSSSDTWTIAHYITRFIWKHACHIHPSSFPSRRFIWITLIQAIVWTTRLAKVKHVLSRQATTNIEQRAPRIRPVFWFTYSFEHLNVFQPRTRHTFSAGFLPVHVHVRSHYHPTHCNSSSSFLWCNRWRDTRDSDVEGYMR